MRQNVDGTGGLAVSGRYRRGRVATGVSGDRYVNAGAKGGGGCEAAGANALWAYGRLRGREVRNRFWWQSMKV